MKKSILLVLTSLSLVSCATGPNAQTGAVMGGLGGAAIGGIIGSQSGRGLEGAAIGGALGALGGNAIGNSRDQQQGGYYNRSGRNYQQQGYYDSYGNYHAY
jgi:uncharacterized protein YcfJ